MMTITRYRQHVRVIRIVFGLHILCECECVYVCVCVTLSNIDSAL